MFIQRDNLLDLVREAKKRNKRIVVGGCYPSAQPTELIAAGADIVVRGEAEGIMPQVQAALENGSTGVILELESRPAMTQSPRPRFDLLKLDHYGNMSIQTSRGCPYDCEFCDVVKFYGRKPRYKPPAQILDELQLLYRLGWRDNVFICDDNFIGHKKKLKNELLPAVISWMKSNKHPFYFITEASIDLSDDKDLMDMMVKAGFAKVFVGIETPEESCLMECNKVNNKNRDLIDCVKIIQRYGMEVYAGFIVGFDNDPPNIFQRQIDFIQKSGIITAMVGLLNAPRLSKLYRRLENEGRITDEFTGDNTDYSMNFVPVMDKEELMKGYREIIKSIYSGKAYYTRVLLFLKQYDPPFTQPLSMNRFMALIKSIIYLGVLTKNRIYFWKIVFWSILNKPKAFPLAVTYSIYGYHFRRVFRDVI
jgi:radical SAM superfamily enzyme YgiQ (UPF0313 family)